MGKFLKLYAIFVVFCFLIEAKNCYAQQDPLFTHYITNRMIVNPSSAGIRNRPVANVLYRTQWVNEIDGAPKTYTVSYSMPIKNNRVGLGLYFIQDELGPTCEREISGTYAYHIPFGDSKLSLGVQFGFKFMQFNLEGNIGDSSDPTYDDFPNNAWKPNFNVGIQYQTEQYFVGLSTKDLLNQNYSSYDDEVNFTTYNTSIHYYFIGGYYWEVAKNWVVRPSVMGKYVQNSPMQFDFTAMAYYKNSLSFGLAYRTLSAASFLVQYELWEDLFLGYSYDYYFNKIQNVSSGSHEIQLEFSFDFFNTRTRVKTPRYF